MGRPTTLPSEWVPISDAVGGAAALRRILGWSEMTFFRRTRGTASFRKTDRLVVEQLCKQHKVPCPLPPESFSPKNIDTADLRSFGDELSHDFPPAPQVVKDLRAKYDEATLIDLADHPATHEHVLRAVTYLLGE